MANELKLEDTLNNFFVLIIEGLLTNNVLALYLFYFINKGKYVTIRSIVKATKLAPTTIVLFNRVLATLGLLAVSVGSGGRANKITQVNLLDDEKLSSILNSSTIRDDLEKLRNNKAGIGSHRSELAMSMNPIPRLVRIILKALPKDQRGFYVTEDRLRDLDKMDITLDFKDYTNWFVEEKIRTGKITRFNLGIFCFRGIFIEYKTNLKERARKDKRIYTSSRVKPFREYSKAIESWREDMREIRKKI